MSNIYDIPKKAAGRGNISWLKWAGAALVVLFFLLLRFFISLKLDYTWFNVLGYSQVFWRTLQVKLLFGLGVFILAVVLNYINISIIYKVTGRKIKQLIALPLAIVAATFVVGNAADLWLDFLKAYNAVPFGVTDPQYGLDISFYVFRLPFLGLLYRLLNSWLLVNLVLSIPLYLILIPRGGVEISARDMTMRILSGTEKRGLSHIGVLLGLLLSWQAVQFKLATYELLYSQVGSVTGAGAADIGVRIPAYYLMMAVSLAAGGLVFVTFSRRIRFSLVAIGLYFIILVAATGLFPGIYQKFIVSPDELGKEQPYLEHNIRYTRMAYGLDNLTEVEYPVGELTSADLDAGRDIIENIRLLDHRATKSAYAQQQELRPYYDFVDVDVDRYMIDGRLTQVLLSARELNRGSLAEQAQTFNNLMFKYTHGFGLVMSPANRVNTRGLPDYLIQDIPPVSAHIDIEEPRVYFGEITSDNVIVNTGLKEFDYPLGDDNQEYLYQGDKGIPMTFMNKLLFTVRDMQFRYMLSNYITPESMYLETRNIKERVQRIAPFLSYDQDPYLVVGNEGRLYYFIDGYTLSDKYPYSQALDDSKTNYLRNSVKVTVDAYSGEVNYYIFDPDDPIINVFANIYPTLFKSAEAMPADLREHLRYPEDLFTVQSMMLRDYHMSNTTVFYNREDRWELSQENYAGKRQAQEPYYSIIQLPGQSEVEFVLMRMYTPSGKQNSVAWLAGRSDRENYGKLLLYKFPKGVQVAGTIQVESMIDQDPDISSQLTLWSQGGSNVIRGNLLVYPLKGSLLYVEPLYIESGQNQYPQLTKVFVFYKDSIVMADTLEQGLLSLFGASTAEPEPGDGILPEPAEGDGTVSELINRLAGLYRQGQEKLKAGEWGEYGRIQAEMEQIIGQLEE